MVPGWIYARLCDIYILLYRDTSTRYSTHRDEMEFPSYRQKTRSCWSLPFHVSDGSLFLFLFFLLFRWQVVNDLCMVNLCIFRSCLGFGFCYSCFRKFRQTMLGTFATLSLSLTSVRATVIRYLPLVHRNEYRFLSLIWSLHTWIAHNLIIFGRWNPLLS